MSEAHLYSGAPRLVLNGLRVFDIGYRYCGSVSSPQLIQRLTMNTSEENGAIEAPAQSDPRESTMTKIATGAAGPVLTGLLAAVIAPAAPLVIIGAAAAGLIWPVAQVMWDRRHADRSEAAEL
jgi:hypothetical protein